MATSSSKTTTTTIPAFTPDPRYIYDSSGDIVSMADGSPYEPDVSSTISSIGESSSTSSVTHFGASTTGESKEEKKTVSTPPPPDTTLDLTDDEAKFFTILAEMNGFDFYNADELAIGPIEKTFNLKLPNDLNLKKIICAPNKVGSGSIIRNLTRLECAKIYTLNKNACPSDQHKIAYGAIRLEMVKCGWYLNQKEVDLVPPPADSGAIFKADLKDIVPKAKIYQTIAFVQPLFAELVFRTTGHHYLSTGDANADYKRRYNKLYDASLIGQYKETLSSDYQFYNINHWVSPGRAYHVMRALQTSERLPEAVKVRIDSAPAGTALITTTAAALKVVSVFKIHTAIQLNMGVDVKSIFDMAATIKADPAKFHKTYRAYGRSPLNASDTKALETAMEAARIIAPITRAAIDVWAAKSELAKAVVFKKHVDSAPIIHQRALKFFRRVNRSSPDSFNDVFKDLSLPTIPIPVVTPVVTTTTTPSI